MKAKHADTAGPRLAAQALSTIRTESRAIEDREPRGTELEREANREERIRAVQFVIHTGKIYEPILEQYRSTDPDQAAA